VSLTANAITALPRKLYSEGDILATTSSASPGREKNKTSPASQPLSMFRLQLHAAPPISLCGRPLPRLLADHVFRVPVGPSIVLLTGLSLVFAMCGRGAPECGGKVSW
jgi:hypothetical protein